MVFTAVALKIATASNVAAFFILNARGSVALRSFFPPSINRRCVAKLAGNKAIDPRETAILHTAGGKFEQMQLACFFAMRLHNRRSLRKGSGKRGELSAPIRPLVKAYSTVKSHPPHRHHNRLPSFGAKVPEARMKTIRHWMKMLLSPFVCSREYETKITAMKYQRKIFPAA